MPVTVHAFCQYLTRTDGTWRNDDYNASKFVKAIKGEPIKGWADVPLLGTRRRLDQQNAHEAVEWLAMWAADVLDTQWPFEEEVVLIPVPSSNTVVTSATASRTARIAERIAARLYFDRGRVLDVLRWSRPMVPSHQGGARAPGELLRSLRVIDAPWPRADRAIFVLVDDVVSLGGHLRACAAALRSRGTAVKYAFAAGRTVLAPLPDPFDVPEETLADFDLP